jgi:hypothetical protein
MPNPRLSHGADALDNHARRSVRPIPRPRPGVDVPDNLAVPFVVPPRLSPRPSLSLPQRPGADALDNPAREMLLLRPRPTLRLGADAQVNLAAKLREMLTLWPTLLTLPLRNCKWLTHAIAYKSFRV